MFRWKGHDGLGVASSWVFTRARVQTLSRRHNSQLRLSSIHPKGISLQEVKWLRLSLILYWRFVSFSLQSSDVVAVHRDSISSDIENFTFFTLRWDVHLRTKLVYVRYVQEMNDWIMSAWKFSLLNDEIKTDIVPVNHIYNFDTRENKCQ